MKKLLVLSLLFTFLSAASPLRAQEEPEGQESASPVRGSLVEDRAARKLLEAGDARLEADEPAKAVEIWQSVIERYPRSRVRFDAHMRLGKHFLQRERAADRARGHFETAASEENRDDQQRAEAMLNMGICFYEAGNYGKCFKVMRDVIEQFPVSKEVNKAYYYIGLGHFQLGHYSRAIQALEKVGTALASQEGTEEKLEAGKRLYVKIEDADLAVLNADDTVTVQVATALGDTEEVVLYPVGRRVRVVLGSIVTTLGKPQPNNGVLEVRGDDKIKITYIDAQTADQQLNRDVTREITVVGNGRVEIADGAFADRLEGVVLDRGVNVQVSDADRDVSDAADTVEAVVGVYREKTQEEIEAETAALLGQAGEGDEQPAVEIDETTGQPKIDPFKLVDEVKVVLTEAVLPKQSPRSGLLAVPGPDEAPSPDEAPGPDEATDSDEAPQPEKEDSQPPAEAAVPSAADDGSVHSGVFRAVVPLVRGEEAIAGDDTLQALPNDVVRVTYFDERFIGEGSRTVTTSAQVIEGNLGGVRVTQSRITDQELRIQTQLKTASALTNIGNRYKEFGLKENANRKYEQALEVCDAVYQEAQQLGGRLLEETYVQLWQIYFAMDKLELAAGMAQRLEREFPNSNFVDDALLQLADVARKQGDRQRAIGLYSRLVAMEGSQLRGEAQFGIAECYEEMAKAVEGPGAAQLYDRAFQEYKKVFDQFPDSGRVGEAVAKMANYYYDRQDYSRAVDVFETVLSEHPDARFLDVILFNYGRCLFRMNRRAEAQQQFNQLIADFPESPLATDAKRIADALARLQNQGASQDQPQDE